MTLPEFAQFGGRNDHVRLLKRWQRLGWRSAPEPPLRQKPTPEPPLEPPAKRAKYFALADKD